MNKRLSKSQVQVLDRMDSDYVLTFASLVDLENAISKLRYDQVVMLGYVDEDDVIKRWSPKTSFASDEKLLYEFASLYMDMRRGKARIKRFLRRKWGVL